MWRYLLGEEPTAGEEQQENEEQPGAGPQRETEEGGRWRETRRERDRDREGEKYARMKEFIPNSYRKGESERGKTSERERERE